MRLLRINGACETTGDKRATFYAKQKAGLICKPVAIGGRARAWPEDELHAINRARVRGASDDEIRDLVRRLEGARATACEEPAPARIDFSPPMTSPL
jgi:prophage regulatory protein